MAFVILSFSKYSVSQLLSFLFDKDSLGKLCKEEYFKYR